jgi:glycosyltransferase involved in cell wall biosynthesis
LSTRPRFLVTFLAWARGISGGDRHLLDVARRWRDHVDVSVLAPPEAAETIGSFLGDVPYYELGAAGERQAALGPALALEYLRRSLRAAMRRQPHVDVVVAASHFIPDAVALAKFARRDAVGVSYVYHLVGERRGLKPRTLWSKGDENIGLALLRRYAEVVFVPNAEVQATLAERRIDSVRTAIGVDFASFHKTDPRTAGARAAFVARMSHTKGVSDAVRAWASIRRAVPDAALMMVGDGPEREPAAALAESLGVADSIDWRGFVLEQGERRLLADTRVLLAPSYEEGWGISVCEALASGVPVVAYRLPALDELFGSAYLAAPPGDVDALADLVVRVLTDDSLADDLSQRGLETAKRYDVARVAEEELSTILDRLGSNRAS